MPASAVLQSEECMHRVNGFISLLFVYDYQNNGLNNIEVFPDEIESESVTINSVSGTLASRGNVTLDMGNIGVSSYFIDIDGTDNNIKTTADNDFRLGTNAAILNVRRVKTNVWIIS